MKNKKTSGKLTITGFLMVAVVVYGSFIAVKFISAGVSETQIGKEVEEAISAIRGPEMTDERASEEARNVLLKKDVIFNPDDPESVIITINRREGKIQIQLKYDILVDCFLFKYTKKVNYSAEMLSYN